jgi:hypothetical protein
MIVRRARVFAILLTLIVFLILLSWPIHKSIFCNTNRLHFDNDVDELIQEEDDAIEAVNMIYSGGECDYEQKARALESIHATYDKFNTVLEKGNYGNLRPEFIINRAENFREQMLQQHVELPEFKTIEREKKKAVTKVISEVKKQALPTRKDTVIAFLDTSKTNTSDKQNVHDRGVSEDIKTSYKKIVAGQVEHFQGETFADISSELSTHAKKEHIVPVLDRMKSNLYIVNIGAGECDILVNVWNRAYFPDNADKIDEMHEAIADQLADCYQDGKVMCGTGRVNRIIGALATLDCDPEVGLVMTSEAYRNEVFVLATRSLNRTIAKYAASKDADEKLQAATFTHAVDDSEVPEQTRQKFADDVLLYIDEYIELHKEKLPKNIRDEVLAGLSL